MSDYGLVSDVYITAESLVNKLNAISASLRNIGGWLELLLDSDNPSYRMLARRYLPQVRRFVVVIDRMIPVVDSMYNDFREVVR